MFFRFYENLEISRRKIQEGEKGGEDMIDDSIRAVKEAEKNASQIILDAHSSADQMIKQAEAEAEQIRTDAGNGAAKDAEEKMEEARKKGAEELKQADALLDKDRQGLEAIAGNKVEQAAEAVIREILS